jgi:phytoene synthase
MVSLAESYRYAERLTRAEAKNFFYSFRFLPPHKRQSICAVYAFSRRCDDTVDAVEEASVSPEQARSGLAHLSSFLGQAPPEDPLVPALQDTMRRFSIPRTPLDDLIAGMEMDLVKKRYETFDELYQYCYRAASVVGLVCIRIFEYTDEKATDFAVQLGIAMQLTNILRDVLEDRDRGRRYLPAEEVARFGYSDADLEDGTVNESFRELMRFQVARAREYFESAEPLFELLAPDARYCPVLLMRFYKKILEHIEAQDYDVLHRRPRLSLPEKVRLAGSLWLEATAARLRS